MFARALASCEKLPKELPEDRVGDLREKVTVAHPAFARCENFFFEEEGRVASELSFREFPLVAFAGKGGLSEDEFDVVRSLDNLVLRTAPGLEQ